VTTRAIDEYELGPMPADRRFATTDALLVRAPRPMIFSLAADVERWPALLPHYRYVRVERRTAHGGRVAMSASRPFGPLRWPTWWTSLMDVHADDNAASPTIRFRHVHGITRGMDVAWTFDDVADGTLVRIVHVWNGPRWPLIGRIAARAVIGPVFVHGIASRTLAGLARIAERTAARGVTAQSHSPARYRGG